MTLGLARTFFYSIEIKNLLFKGDLGKIGSSSITTKILKRRSLELRHQPLYCSKASLNTHIQKKTSQLIEFTTDFSAEVK